MSVWNRRGHALSESEIEPYRSVYGFSAAAALIEASSALFASRFIFGLAGDAAGAGAGEGVLAGAGVEAAFPEGGPDGGFFLGAIGELHFVPPSFG